MNASKKSPTARPLKSRSPNDSRDYLFLHKLTKSGCERRRADGTRSLLAPLPVPLQSHLRNDHGG
jgi:hypothetical protein